MEKEDLIRNLKLELSKIERENKTYNTGETRYDLMIKDVLNYIENSIPKQVIVEKLEERRQAVEKCYQDLIKPYYDEKLNIINTSFMSKKEKEEFINKRNCLLVQKHCYEEILSFMEGEKQ